MPDHVIRNCGQSFVAQKRPKPHSEGGGAEVWGENLRNRALKKNKPAMDVFLVPREVVKSHLRKCPVIVPKVNHSIDAGKLQFLRPFVRAAACSRVTGSWSRGAARIGNGRSSGCHLAVFRIHVLGFRAQGGHSEVAKPISGRLFVLQPFVDMVEYQGWKEVQKWSIAYVTQPSMDRIQYLGLEVAY